MDFFDRIGDLASTVAKPLLAFATGGPLAALQSVSTPSRKPQILERNESQMPIQSFGGSAFNEGQFTAPPQLASQSSGFFGNLGQTLGDFGRGAASFVRDVAPLTDLFGITGGQQAMAPQAAKTITRQPPEETAMSGEILGANLGIGGALVQGARQFARSPAGQGLIGGGLGIGGALVASSGNGMPRVTRRMKADVRRIYMMAGMNPNVTAQILNNLGTYPKFNFDASLVFFILTKRFRNDGPVVTKAAVRKTRTTLRRMKGIVDLHNSICKTTTRRTPARRAAPKAVQLIKN